MSTPKWTWSLAGLAAGVVGLATSYFLAMVMTIRESPVVAVAELVIRLTPGALVEKAIAALGTNDKPFLVVMVLILTAVAFLFAGRLAARSWWAAALVFAVLAVLGGVSVGVQRGSGVMDQLPVLAGFVTWLVALSLLAAPLQRADRAEAAPSLTSGVPARPAAHHRRSFLIGAGAMGAVSVAVWLVGGIVGRGRRHVEQTRSLLRLDGISEPEVPADIRIGVEGVAPWMTPATEFYRIHTAILLPAIEPADWELRIHGMVDRELRISYKDLVSRQFTEDWITLNCVSNPVGGPYIGNAWWSGVRLADILAEAGVQDGADAVLQTSDDGWNCGTPLSALTDDRNAMLAIAMNGQPLPIDHGFPVRTIVPGLYGYVSATKWVVDMEVTRFSEITAYWTERGWGAKGPVKLSSRIDVPRSGDDVSAGSVSIGGVAWAQHTGISAVEVAFDGGDWRPAELAGAPSDDTWVQWKAVVDLAAGDHVVRVRATDKDGLVQTGVVRDVLPDGSTGWHTVAFTTKA